MSKLDVLTTMIIVTITMFLLWGIYDFATSVPTVQSSSTAFVLRAGPAGQVAYQVDPTTYSHGGGVTSMNMRWGPVNGTFSNGSFEVTAYLESCAQSQGLGGSGGICNDVILGQSLGLAGDMALPSSQAPNGNDVPVLVTMSASTNVTVLVNLEWWYQQ